jgi:hypothetical protein
MEKLNREGVYEPRMSAIPTNRRASPVWRLTAKGRVAVKHLHAYLGDDRRLPGPKRASEPEIEGVISKDGQYVQERVV